ncbi:activator-dependent family glycosyltransferase [Thermomonospora echinospora]|nr:activator-dependent family glycosyltransferase [Thermomonospora echinospora]
MFVTTPTKAPGHHRVPLAWALRAAGHEVRLVDRPNLVADITRTGLTAVPIGEALEADENIAASDRLREGGGIAADVPGPEDLMRIEETRPEKLTYDFMHGVLTVMTTTVFRTFSPPRTIEELVAFAREWRPDLVLWDPLVFAGPVAAKACGAAHARLLYGLDMVALMRGRYLAAMAERPPEWREDPLEEWLGPVLERYGCSFGEDVVTGQWTIDPVPPSQQLPTGIRYVPMRHVPYNGPSVVPKWLRETPKRPRVCLSLTLPHPEVTGGDRVPVAALLEALGGLDVEVVAPSSPLLRDAERDLPGNVRVVDSAPLNELLPSCSVIIHQSDVWTLHTAFAHGVPQLVLPGELWDIPMRAVQVREAGAGLTVPDVEHATAGELRALLLRLLNEPSFARNAARLQRELMSTPAPSDTVARLERLTDRHRRRTA